VDRAVLPPSPAAPSELEVDVTDRLAQIEGQLASIARGLEQLEARVSALEARPAATAARRQPPGSGPAASPADATVTARAAGASLGAFVPLGGRTLLVLAGAFVLRALTEAETLPRLLGVGLGFAYAGAFVALADRAAARGQRDSAWFHGLAAALIGFPLLFEATTRFQLLPVPLAALLLVGFSAGELAVAVRRKLELLCWITTLAGIGVAVGLAISTGQLVAPTLALMVLGVATLWVAYVLDWYGPRWPVALATDFLVLVVAVRATSGHATEGPVLALTVTALLVLAYVGSFAARTLVLGRTVIPFEVAQTLGALTAGLGGAAWVMARSVEGAVPFGALIVAMGVGAYAAAFAFVDRRESGPTNFYFYTSVGLPLLLLGTERGLPGWASAATWGLLAVAAAFLARSTGRRTLAVHALLLALAAAAGSGLLQHADRALFGAADVAWPPLSPIVYLVLACLAVTTVVSGGGARRAGWQQRLPQFASDVLLALSAAGVLAGWLVTLLGPPGPEAGLGAIASARTGVLAGGALLAAWLGRREAWREAGGLAWPLLILLGLKILLEDLAKGRPATLMLSFACYGAALILVPRLRARAPAAGPVPAQAGTEQPGGAPPAAQPAAAPAPKGDHSSLVG
jgi:hypothetical protein